MFGSADLKDYCTDYGVMLATILLLSNTEVHNHSGSGPYEGSFETFGS